MLCERSFRYHVYFIIFLVIAIFLQHFELISDLTGRKPQVKF